MNDDQPIDQSKRDTLRYIAGVTTGATAGAGAILLTKGAVIKGYENGVKEAEQSSGRSSPASSEETAADTTMKIGAALLIPDVALDMSEKQTRRRAILKAGGAAVIAGAGYVAAKSMGANIGNMPDNHAGGLGHNPITGDATEPQSHAAWQERIATTTPEASSETPPKVRG